MTQNETYDRFYFFNLQSWRKQSALRISFWVIFKEIWPFFNFHNFHQIAKNCKIEKGPYPFKYDSKWKSKSTLLSSIFKVDESKVLLDFHFESYSKRYGPFLNLAIFCYLAKIAKIKKGPYLFEYDSNWKFKTTFVASTFKGKKVKWSLFFIWRHILKGIAIFKI